MVNFSVLPSVVLVRVLAVLILLTLRLSAAAQAPAWQSAQTVAVAIAAAPGGSSAVQATAVDAAGNVYLAGYFTNTVVLGTTTLTSLGSYDIFVAKFSPISNQFVWAQRAGGTGGDLAFALAVSGTSVYIAGNIHSPTVNFGSTTIASPGSTSSGFVAKLEEAGNTGNFIWGQPIGSTNDVTVKTLAASGTSVYVAGGFAGTTASFGAITLTNFDTSGSYSEDGFVAKLTDAGSTSSFVWAQQVGGVRSDRANALAVSGGSVYVGGGFDSLTASFGAITLNNTPSSVALFGDVFVAKLLDAGSTSSFVWAKRAGGLGGKALPHWR
ncbi:hypothetical protein [Hymenobacter properus]|uniref:SBBP repeat-containing protein n=1 Tax=Hymenobacter properus TaxID=2791026 RepID=A0A931BF21_9BACT|nr:hypothetical protein [Hymenobacter properus]MBF9142234.1 hypothetical protein [Hymenobacter properus]MBR7721041.1 hypothetical protein [Microvirga sp. SRT04]